MSGLGRGYLEVAEHDGDLRAGDEEDKADEREEPEDVVEALPANWSAR